VPGVPPLPGGGVAPPVPGIAVDPPDAVEPPEPGSLMDVPLEHAKRIEAANVARVTADNESLLIMGSPGLVVATRRAARRTVIRVSQNTSNYARMAGEIVGRNDSIFCKVVVHKRAQNNTALAPVLPAPARC